MGREGTEALLDTLLIPDICINVMEYGQFGAVQRRDVKPRLAHQRKEANRL